MFLHNMQFAKDEFSEIWRRALLTIMSTYIDVAHPNRHAPYTDIPDLVMDYLHYLDVVKLRSPRTINGYFWTCAGSSAI